MRRRISFAFVVPDIHKDDTRTVFAGISKRKLMGAEFIFSTRTPKYVLPSRLEIRMAVGIEHVYAHNVIVCR